MNLEELMRELSRRLGMDEVALDLEGSGQIVIDDELAIDIVNDDQGRGFSFSATVGPAPRQAREAVFAELLEANLVGQGTAGSALALDPVLEELVLCRSIRQDELPFEAFEQELTDFVQVLRFWRERHAAGEIGHGVEAEPEADSTRLEEMTPPRMLRV